MATETIFDNSSAASPASSVDTRQDGAPPPARPGREKRGGDPETLFGGNVSAPTHVDTRPQRREEPQEAPERDEPPPRRAREPEPQNDDNDETDDLYDDDLTPKAKPKREADDDDGEDGEGGEADDETEDEDDEDPEHEVTVGAETRKVRQSELVKHYSQGQDFAKRTEALDADVRMLHDYAGESMKAREAAMSLAEEANALFQALSVSQEDWDRLKAVNPQEYIRQQDAWAKITAKQRELVNKARGTVEQGNSEGDRNRTAYVAQETRKLQTSLPSLFDDKKGPQIRERIFKYGESIGVSRKDLAERAVSHAEIMTLYKAMRFDEIVEQRRNNGTRKAARANRAPRPQIGVSRPETAQARPQNPSNRSTGGRPSNLANAQRQLQRTGRVEDAGAAFTELLKTQPRK